MKYPEKSCEVVFPTGRESPRFCILLLLRSQGESRERDFLTIGSTDSRCPRRSCRCGVRRSDCIQNKRDCGSPFPVRAKNPHPVRSGLRSAKDCCEASHASASFAARKVHVTRKQTSAITSNILIIPIRASRLARIAHAPKRTWPRILFISLITIETWRVSGNESTSLKSKKRREGLGSRDLSPKPENDRSPPAA